LTRVEGYQITFLGAMLKLKLKLTKVALSLFLLSVLYPKHLRADDFSEEQVDEG
jgi:hypothetical protein